jgi:hypothetical protein
MTVRNFSKDINNDLSDDLDSSFDSHTQIDMGDIRDSKFGRAKEVIKDGLSDVQKRFEGSGIGSWRTIVPVAILGTIGVIAYSRRHSEASSGLKQSKSKVKKPLGRKGASSKIHSQRTHA